MRFSEDYRLQSASTRGISRGDSTRRRVHGSVRFRFGGDGSFLETSTVYHADQFPWFRVAQK